MYVWSAMSGVESSKEPKEPQVHVCKSCVETVVQTFTYLQEQIAQLRQDKKSLQDELMRLSEEHEEQKRVLAEQVRALEKKLRLLEKGSETNI